MRHLFIPAVLLSLLGVGLSSAADDTSGFSLSIAFTKCETSKDSHTSRYTIGINGREVRYQWQYTGFPDDKNEARTWTMSPAVQAKLLEYIRTHRLTRNLREIRSATGIGLSVDVTWTLVQSGRTNVIRLQGMYNDWSKRDSKPCNIDNIALYHRIEAVIASLRNRNDYF